MDAVGSRRGLAAAWASPSRAKRQEGAYHCRRGITEGTLIKPKATLRESTKKIIINTQKVLCSEGHSALTFNFRDGTFPIEDTNEENFCSISRHRPPLFRRPPAVCTRRLRKLPRKSNSHSCCRRLCRCIFRLRSRSRQSSPQFVQVVRHK
jgi:hypothetical protein